MRHLRARRPVLVLAALWWLLYNDHTGLARIGLLAALLHESGHVLAWAAITRTLPVLRFSTGGIGLDTSRAVLGRRQTFFLALAGPAVNLGACAIALAALQHRASYWGYFFAAANLALGGFNQLPFGPMDGRQMLAALRRRADPVCNSRPNGLQ